MNIKLCSDCSRPLWEGKCLYGKGFLDGIKQGRTMNNDIELDKIYHQGFYEGIVSSGMKFDQELPK